MSCELGCYEMQIACCDSPVISAAGLAPDTLYQSILTRPGSKTIYKKEFTTDGTGALTILKDDLPDGFFGYGYIEVKLRKGAGFTEEQKFTIATVQYDCLLLELADIDDD